MDRRFFLKTGAAALAAGTVAEFGAISSYYDRPWFHNWSAAENNCIAIVVSGIVAQKMYGQGSSIDIEMQRTLFSGTKIKGSASKDSIDTYLRNADSTAAFRSMDVNGNLEGRFEEDEYHKTVVQEGEGSFRTYQDYPNNMFDNILSLKVDDGIISGNCVFMGGSGQSIAKIRGKYDTSSGNVKVDVTYSLPNLFGFSLHGKITEKTA